MAETTTMGRVLKSDAGRAWLADIRNTNGGETFWVVRMNRSTLPDRYWLGDRWSEDGAPFAETEAAVHRLPSREEALAVERRLRDEEGELPVGRIEAYPVFGVASLSRLARESADSGEAERRFRDEANFNGYSSFPAVGSIGSGYIVRFRDADGGVEVDVLSPSGVG